MASNQEFWAQCVAHEMPSFVRVLKALPNEQLGYKPHEKNTCAGDLAWQLAVEMGHLSDLLDKGVINFEPTPRPESLDAIVADFEKNGEALKTRVASIDDAKWSSPADFRMGGQSVWSATVQELAWGYLFDMIHHRGQLSVYIRPMGGKVPSIYGPSADDAGGPS
jgi:uncharacterized damage-inducible protein DinB